MSTEKYTNPEKAQSPWRFLFWGCTAYGILNLLGGIAGYLLTWICAVRTAAGASHAATIGIIGGADGPTAIFVTTPPWTAYLFPMLALAVGISGLVWLRKKQKKES